MDGMSVTVVFLARGIDGGIEPARLFLQSYFAHPAGYEHELVLVSKGWDGIENREELDDLATSAGARIIELPDDGYDFGAYFRAAAHLDSEYLFFLNTHSRIIGDNWLGLLMLAANNSDVGLAGCTGSWGVIVPSWRLGLSFASHRLKSKRYLDTFKYLLWGVFEYAKLRIKAFRRFPTFPNPHIRTNAFLVRRNVFLGFVAARKLPKNKLDCYALESGYDGLTRYVSRCGLKSVVIGADAVARGPRIWWEAETFAVPGQKFLLISDNRTREYETSTLEKRRELELLFWGRTLSIVIGASLLSGVITA